MKVHVNSKSGSGTCIANGRQAVDTAQPSDDTRSPACSINGIAQWFVGGKWGRDR